MADKVQDILDILQEECAEVIQAISKCRRFGIDEVHLKSGTTMREQLIQELGDVTLLISLLKAHEVFSDDQLVAAEQSKAAKLKKYSSIYDI